MGNIVIAIVAMSVRLQLGRLTCVRHGCLDILCDAPLGAVGYVAHAVFPSMFPNVYSSNFTTSSPIHSLSIKNCDCSGTSSLRANTRAAGSTAPKPPALLG